MRSLPRSAHKGNHSKSLSSKKGTRPPIYNQQMQQRSNITYNGGYRDQAVRIDVPSQQNRTHSHIDNDQTTYFEPISQQLRMNRQNMNLPRFSQLGVIERNTLWQAAREAKIQRARDACRDIDLVGCTFHPNVKNAYSSNNTPRSSNNISAIGSSISRSQTRRLTSLQRQILTHSNSYTQIHNIKSGRNNSSFFSSSSRNEEAKINKIQTSNINSCNISQNFKQTPKNQENIRQTGHFRFIKGNQYSLSEQRPNFNLTNRSPSTVTKKFLSHTATVSPRTLLNSNKKEFEIDHLNTFAQNFSNIAPQSSASSSSSYYHQLQQMEQGDLIQKQYNVEQNPSSISSTSNVIIDNGMFYGGGGTGEFQSMIQGSSGGGEQNNINQYQQEGLI